jgi:hypothetical protein
MGIALGVSAVITCLQTRTPQQITYGLFAVC